MSKRKEMIADTVAVVVTVMWTSCIVLTIFRKDFQVPSTVQLIMSIITGGLFGDRVLMRVRKVKDQENDEDKDESSGDAPGHRNVGNRGDWDNYRG